MVVSDDNYDNISFDSNADMANSKDDDYENVSLDSHVVAANDKDDDYENISLDSGSDIDNVIEKKDEEECIDISAILQIQKWWHIHYA